MSTQPAERTLDTELFGRDVTFQYSETWVGHAVLSLRIIMAWVFFQAGLEKLLDPAGWTAAGYLQHAVVDTNPFAPFYAGLAGSPVIDALVIYGQLGIGLALFLGILVRFAAFWGTLMMILFWLSQLQGGLLAGLPVEHGFVVNSTLVYAFILFGLAAVGAGRILGLDNRLEATSLVQNNPWLKYLLA